MSDNNGRGTKNLGLMKAIHVGINPPLNTKLIWYNDSTTPYTTGPAKVHYYYDIITSDWQPLQSTATLSGNYGYIAYASNCDGGDFSLIRNRDRADISKPYHTHWALIISDNPIPNPTPDLFENLWTTYCDSVQGGNYTYVGYADSCDGDNFSLEKNYKVPCDEVGKCEYITKAIRDNHVSSSSINLTEIQDGFRLSFNSASKGDLILVNLEISDEKLKDLTDYCIETHVESGTTQLIDGMLAFNLENNQVGGQVLSPISQTGVQSFIDTSSVESQILIWIPQTYKSKINGNIDFKIGTKECCPNQKAATNPPLKDCYKSRTCIAIITSDEEIENPNVDTFEGLWNCFCCTDSKDINTGKLDNLEKQMSILNKNVSETELIQSNKIKTLQGKTNNNKINISNLDTRLNKKIDDNNSQQDEENLLLKGEIKSLKNLVQQLTTRVANIEKNTTNTKIISIVSPEIDKSLNDFKNEELIPETTKIDNKLSDFISGTYSSEIGKIDDDQSNQNDEINGLKIRVDKLENPPK